VGILINSLGVIRLRSIVSIVKVINGYVYEAVSKAIDLIGGISKYVGKGDRVVVKPNLTRATNKPHICTSPEVVAAVIKLCNDAGAKEVIVAESSPIGVDTEKAFEISGIKSVATKMGARILDLRKCRFVKIPIPRGKVLREVEIAEPILNADALINVPKMKTHYGCTITCALKNMKGVISDLSKRIMHRAGIKRAIAELNTVIKPTLTIVDGIICMEGLGPVDGDPIRMDLVIAGEDPLAIDSICARVMGFNPEEIEVLRYAYELGIGAFKPHEIEVVGEELERVVRRFKPPPSDLREYFKLAGIYVKNACSGCISTLIIILNTFKEEGILDKIKEYYIVTGSINNIPKDAEGRKIVLLGNCTSKFKSLGLFIPGCPPRLGLAIPVLKMGRLVDKYEVYLEKYYT